MKYIWIVVLACFVSACNADTDDVATQNGDAQERAAEQADSDTGTAVAAFSAAFPDIPVQNTRSAPMPGMVELELANGDIVYLSDSGQYMMVGKLLELRDGEVVDVADLRYQKVRKEGIAELDEADLITYAADNEQHEIYVFTDISCGYCRRLHRHMSEFNDMGVTVHYLAFPRGGAMAQSAKQMRHIWCDANPAQAMSDAKLENRMSNASLTECAKPVDTQYELGLAFGVRGTPAIFTSEGEHLGGYLAPKDLAQALQN